MWPLRSFLFVPAHRKELVPKAIRVRPDAVVLDLEDSVPPEHKAAARALLRESIALLAAERIAPFVRVHAWSDATREDIKTAVHPGLAGVILPKADSVEEVRNLHDLLSFHEGERGLVHQSVAILPLPETAEGLQRAESLARASTRVKGIVGTVSGPVGADVARAFGFRPSMGGLEQLYMQSKLVLDSRAAGAPYPIAGVFGVPMDDLSAVETLLKRARDLGFTGSPVMHPSHVAIANAVYAPTAEEATYYRGLLAAFAGAERAGLGAVRYEGAMIDYAMLPHARSVVEEFDRREQMKGGAG
ncbi:MAG: HpcH/HpaI aldolase/citrate lyase family protein [Burkholderiales bacterium]